MLLGTPGIHAQRTETGNRIGLAEAGAPSANQHFVDAFMAGLRALGHVPGNKVVVDVRSAEGQADGFRPARAEIIGLRPDVIVVSSTLGAVEAKKVTASIPVVFVGVPDPVGPSLAEAGGNLTGVARAAGGGLVGKTVQELREFAPGVTRMAIPWNPGAAIDERRVQAVAAAQAFGITPLIAAVRDRNGRQAAFGAMRNERADALFVVTDPAIGITVPKEMLLGADEVIQ